MGKNKWSGYYMQEENKGEMIFAELKVKPESINGSGSDDCGMFSIFGSVEEGKVSFTKTYESHVVMYNGEINENLTKMWGHWDINDGEVVGEFQMRAVEDDADPKYVIRMDGKLYWRKKGEWTHIGNNVCQLQIYLKHLFVVNDEDHSVWKWNYGAPFEWEKIGEDAKYIFVVEDKVFMKNRKTNQTLQWTLKGDEWVEHNMWFFEEAI